MNAKAVSLIRAFEGFSPTPYYCPGGFKTIGYGHRLQRRVPFPDHVTEEEACLLLAQDMQKTAVFVRRLIRGILTEGQEAALLSFTFNLGPAALQRSTLRLKVNRREHEEVPRELMKWVWSQGRKLPGLVRRRMAEGTLYIFGEDKRT